MSFSSEENHAITLPVQKVISTIKNISVGYDLPITRIYQLISDGEIDARKVGRRTMIIDQSVKDYIARQPRAVIRMGSRVA